MNIVKDEVWCYIDYYSDHYVRNQVENKVRYLGMYFVWNTLLFQVRDQIRFQVKHSQLESRR